MSYPYGRPGGQSGSGDPRGVGASGGQRVPVPGSGGRRSSAGVVVEMNDDKIEPGETRTLVVGFKYIYVGESVVFQTDVPAEENPLEYPYIIVQPS